MLTPQSITAKAVQPQHQQRKGRQFDNGQSQGVIPAGAAQDERNDQERRRRDRDAVPSTFPNLPKHGLVQQYRH